MSWIDAYRREGRLEGRCLCGAVEIVVDGFHVAAVGICHCDMCRRWNGTIFGTFDAAPDAVTVTGEVARHPSSDFAERAFCPTCGSHLWFRDTDRADANYELMPGPFPAAWGFPLVSEIYSDKAPAHAALAGGHRRKTEAEYEATAPHVPDARPDGAAS